MKIRDSKLATQCVANREQALFVEIVLKNS